MAQHSNACRKVSSIPELQTHISTYLNGAELDSLRQTCRAWYYYWAATHYQTCTSTEFKLGELKSKIDLELHGDYVRSLYLENTRSQDTIDFLAHLPNLRSLHLVQAALSPEGLEVFKPYRLTVSSYDVTGRSHVRCAFAPRPPLFPLDDLDIEGRYVGRRLQVVEFGNVAISDEGLLQLLGIDLVSPETSCPSARRTHALTDLTLSTCYTVTHKSGARILQECRSLQRLHVSQSGLASMALFRGTDVWPCSPTIQSVELGIYPENLPPIEPLYHRTAKEGATAFSSVDQEQILGRLQRMTNLRRLILVGYSLDFAAVEDVSFAELLTDARIEMMVRVAPAQVPGRLKEIEARGLAWCQRQPTGWTCYVDISAVAPRLATYRLRLKPVKVARP
ncbi:hypothetical protein MVEG_09542 [Podila verticillata NRRL 6337]|nr:hypothetical protein MVEG_09542 [Podila verticillata NRRL 6337]